MRPLLAGFSVELGLRYALRLRLVDLILPATAASLTLLKIPRSRHPHRVVAFPQALAAPRAIALAHPRQAPLPRFVEARIRYGPSLLLLDLVLVCGLVAAVPTFPSIEHPPWHALRALTDLLNRAAHLQ